MSWHEMDCSKIFSQYNSYQSNLYCLCYGPRKIRHYQRFILKSFKNQILLIYLFLDLNSFNDLPNKFCQSKLYLLSTFQEYKKLSIDISLLNSINYRFFIRYQLKQLIVVLAYLPIYIKLTSVFSNDILKITNRNGYLSCLANTFQYGHFVHLFSFKPKFTKCLKYWYFKNILIELPVLMIWFFESALQNQSSLSVNLVRETYITLEECLILTYLSYTFRLLKEPILRYKNVFLGTSNSFIALKKHSHSLMNCAVVDLIYSKVKPLADSLYLFGWCFQKKNSRLTIDVLYKNVVSHQHEIIKILQSSGILPIDKVIRLLNIKIWLWKHFYFISAHNPSLNLFLNRYLLYRLFYFIKKRYKKKSVNWILTHFFQLQQPYYIFRIHHTLLLSYNL
uniref:Maturase K n=1 Tax=Pedobesia claviformis TaxID=2364088 RepID=A0A386B0W1_9CHLO|nr:hypothetical protein [Pedobesia claviformis]AYC65283.1 hypothetical protein [Pedobesia claviformis]